MAHIQRLRPELQLAAFNLVYYVRVAGVPLQVTSSVRTPQQQAVLVASGRSTTLKSKHLDGLAFDVDIHRWNRSDIPVWWFFQLGQLAEQLGLRWGGRFSGFWDPGHFESRR